MTPDELKQHIVQATEAAHRREYESALALSGRQGPAWDDLTEEQRAAIREENRRYQREMQAFGESLRQRRPAR